MEVGVRELIFSVTRNMVLGPGVLDGTLNRGNMAVSLYDCG
jgi:hypothetical protein